MSHKALVGETGDGVDDEAECTGQGHGALIPEAQGPGSLALTCVGLVDALKERRADGTTLAGTFDPSVPPETSTLPARPPTLTESAGGLCKSAPEDSVGGHATTSSTMLAHVPFTSGRKLSITPPISTILP